MQGLHPHPKPWLRNGFTISGVECRKLLIFSLLFCSGDWTQGLCAELRPHLLHFLVLNKVLLICPSWPQTWNPSGSGYRPVPYPQLNATLQTNHPVCSRAGHITARKAGDGPKVGLWLLLPFMERLSSSKGQGSHLAASHNSTCALKQLRDFQEMWEGQHRMSSLVAIC